MATELELLRAFAKEATVALTGLAGGGSEFFAGKIGEIYKADIPACVERVRQRQDVAHNYIKDLKRRLRDTKAATPLPSSAAATEEPPPQQEVKG